MQWGCYHRLYDIALARSDSKYCLVIDINEFWISNPFPQDIDTFIEHHTPFDAFSFHWLEAIEEVLLDMPLSPNATYKHSPWVKSLFRYDIPLSRIGTHGPVICRKQADICIRLGPSENINTQESLHGTEVMGYSASTAVPSELPKHQAWVIYRANRSELEYATRLLEFESQGDTSFLLRSGKPVWQSRDNGEPIITQCIQTSATEKTLSTYKQSLDRFIENCDIREEINAARLQINEKNLLQRINSLDIEILKRNQATILQAFHGTRFHEVISNRLKHSS